MYSQAKDWFIRLLYFKDEHMLLMTGQIFTTNYDSIHSAYLHKRNGEGHYYKAKCLSFCSVDGIDYEYRQLQSKIPDKYIEVRSVFYLMFIIMCCRD